jgi:hypothetical protein
MVFEHIYCFHLKRQRDKQRSTKNPHQTKDRVTRTPLKRGVNSGAPEGWAVPASYDKRDDFNFPIVNFPFICSNIPAVPAHGVYLCQLTIFQSLWFLSGLP